MFKLKLELRIIFRKFSRMCLKVFIYWWEYYGYVVILCGSKILSEYKIYPNKFTAPLNIYDVTPKIFFS